jgi:hypothetical protein
LHESIDIKIIKSKNRKNPGQMGLTPGAFMEEY